MRRLGLALFALLLATGAQAQTGSNKTQAALNTEIGTTGCSQPTCLFPDNTSGLITPFDLRQVSLDVVATLFTTFPTLTGNNTFSGVNNFTSAFQIGGNVMTFPTAAANLASRSGAWTVGDCLQVASTAGAIADNGAPCGSGGGGGLVNSVFGRTGAVTAQTGDYTAAQISGLGTFATQNFATPPAIGGSTPAAGTFTTLTANTLFNFISTFQANGNTITFPPNSASLAFQTGSFTPGDCIQVASSGAGGLVGGLSDAGSACGSGGGGGGSAANNQTFVAGTNFTPGVTTTLTLSSLPVSQAALYIYEDGVSQPAPSAWTVNLSTGVVTFAAPIQAQNTVYATWLSASITSGTVASVGVATANGFSATVANPTTTPVITLKTSINGVLQGNGTAISAASTTGSGNVVLATSPTITTPTFSGTAGGSNNFPLSLLAQSAANTMLGNRSASGANVAANAMPACTDTSGQHLNYVSGTGVTCGTGTGSAITSLTGDVTATGPGASAATIASNAVTYAKFQQVAASSLVGNSTGSLANAGAISLGATLAFSSSTLQTTAHTGDATSSANSFAMTVVGLQTVPVKSGTPSDGQVLTYVAADSDWEPIAAPSGNVPVGGTTGQVLAKINSTNYNTQWITVSGTGTVTSVTCGTGLSGGTFTTTGTCALITPVVVAFGGTGSSSLTAHGVLLGEGTSAFGVTATGSAGQVLVSGGSSADPAYGSQQTIISKRRTVTSGSSDTATAADFMIASDKGSGSASAEAIPACASGIDGTMYVVVDEKGDAGTNNITVTPASGTILGTTSLVMNVCYSSITLQCDGSQTNWVVE